VRRGGEEGLLGLVRAVARRGATRR
jgi:hypothetical protein